MKVLFSTYTTAFQNPGGGENVILQLKRSLLDHGHQVELFDPLQHDPSKFDVIHHFSAFETDRWSFFKSKNVPLVVTPTIYLKKSLLGFIRWRLHLFGAQLERIALGQGRNPISIVDLWLGATEHECETLKYFYGIANERVALLPNGVDLKFAASNPKVFAERANIDFPFVLHVGRFHPVKNQSVLIQACAKIKVPVVFIGGADDDCRDYRESCVNLARALEHSGAGKLFHFFEREPFGSEFLKSAYAAAAVFALPSEFESFGISALEASVAGLPCVLSNNLADKSVFPRATFVDPQDVNAWALAIKQNLETPVVPTQQEIALVLEKYSWNQISTRLIEYYSKACSTNVNENN